MTGPISGLGPQQVPLSQSLQQGNSEQQERVSRNRDDQESEQLNKVQIKDTASVSTKTIEESRDSRDREDNKTESRASNTAANSNKDTTQRRGSLVDVVV